MKKALSLVLASAMVLSLAACGKTTASSTDTPVSSASDPVVSASTDVPSTETVTYESVVEATKGMDYYQSSEYMYNRALGEFADSYAAAFEAGNASERFALMAIAEAKLLESGVMLPLESKGGNYAISRAVPRTIDDVLYGSDQDRYHSIVCTNELIKAEDIKACRDLWFEVKGTGKYIEKAKEYLAGKGYTFTDSYVMAYSSDPETWDVLATSKANDTDAIINTYDGLLEYDNEGMQQPALATSYDISADGLKWTFHLREGVIWTDSQGRKVADVVADDFVAGFQHMLDAAGGLEFLVSSDEGSADIVGVDGYIDGSITDFAEVGVKAIDDHTLEYTLNKPCAYFNTMLGYSIFAPMSRSFYTSQGGKFGEDYDNSAANYKYGKSPENIAYCGPYLVTNATEKATIVFKASDSYYAPEKVNAKTLTWVFNDGTEATKAYRDTIDGKQTGCGLNSAAVEVCKAEGIFDDYSYIANTDSTSYMAFYNINRVAFANTNDNTVYVSQKSDEEKARTAEAMGSQHFRLALSMAVDRGSYRAQTVGEDLKYAAMRNTYTPGNFVVLQEDTTVDINGVATTFKAGTLYGAVVQAQLDADGIKIKAFDGQSTDLYDGWYSVANCQEELAKAVEELATIGVVVDAEHPIQIDYPYNSASEPYTNRANAYKQSVEASSKGLIQINLLAGTRDDWLYAGYYTEEGSESNYDMYDLSGWGPDYGDPSTYLGTFLANGAGYMSKSCGLW